MIDLRRLVLPAPLRPNRPVIVPSGSVMSTLRKTSTAPIRTHKSRISSMGAPLYPRATDNVLSDFFVREHLVARSVGDNTSLKERDHARYVTGHDFHVVLDKKHRHLQSSDCGKDLIHQLEFFLACHAAGRLIQQEEHGPARHGHRYVQKLARALRQFQHPAVGPMCKRKSIENCLASKNSTWFADRLKQSRDRIFGQALGNRDVFCYRQVEK